MQQCTKNPSARINECLWPSNKCINNQLLISFTNSVKQTLIWTDWQGGRGSHLSQVCRRGQQSPGVEFCHQADIIVVMHQSAASHRRPPVLPGIQLQYVLRYVIMSAWGQRKWDEIKTLFISWGGHSAHSTLLCLLQGSRIAFFTRFAFTRQTFCLLSKRNVCY